MATPEKVAKSLVSKKTKVINSQRFACFGLEEALTEAIRDAVLAEREACARLALEYDPDIGESISEVQKYIASAIGARKD